MSNKIGKTGLGFARVWHHVDLAEEPRTLGRLASHIAITLMGKHKPITHETQDAGDYVVVSNCQFMKISGKNFEKKTYWTHNTRPGKGKATPMKDVAADFGYGELLKRAVSKMLPKNQLRWKRLERLKVFDGSDHPYKQNLIAFADEQPKVLQKIKDLEERTNKLKEFDEFMASRNK